MRKYRSHKVVEAAKVTERMPAGDDRYRLLTAEGDIAYLPKSRLPESASDLGYLVCYGDGYTSWSPTEAFENGYTLIEDE